MLLVLAFVWPLPGGQFKRSLGRGDSLKAKAPASPQVRIGRATLAIDVKDATGGVVVQPAYTGTVDPNSPNSGWGGQGMSAGITTVPLTQLQAALDRVFRESFTIVQSNGEALLRVAVTHYTPAESSIRNLQQKVRAPGTDPVTGQQTTVEHVVAVEQWTARGQLAVRVEVVDSSGALLDGFAPQSSVQGSQVISVDGQDRVDRTQMPTSEQVLDKMIADLVVQFTPRYCPPAVEVEIPLAVDEELRAGNQLAKNGDLTGALKAWEAAVIPKQQNAGDRVHNIGSLYEAQAYDLLMRQAELTKVEPYLQRAGQRYAEAAVLDPEEKYITRAQERVRKALALVESLKGLEQKRQQALDAKASPSQWPPAGTTSQGWGNPNATAGTADGWPTPANTQSQGQPTAGGGIFGDVGGTQPAAQPGVQPSAQPTAWPAWPGAASPASTPLTATATAHVALDPAAQEALLQALNDTRADTAQEAVFRQFVRLRMRSGGALLDDAAKHQIESTGTLGYSLSSLASRRVVHQEAQTWVAVQPKLSAYRDAFTAFAQDGLIAAEERSALKTLAANLGLLDADVKAVEAGRKVAE